MRNRKFLLDLAALIPLDLLQLRLGTQPLLRFPRFLKVIIQCVDVDMENRKKTFHFNWFLFLFHRFIDPLSFIISLRVELFGQIYGV